MSTRQRIANQPAWILHAHPWRETSLIVEVLSRDHGRVAMVAKGARRPMSALRGVLMAFQPLVLDWSGGGEVKTLVRGEWRGGQSMLGGQGLLCAYYINELMLRLTAREDPHPLLFNAYEAAMRALSRARDGLALAMLLRRFELVLLRELGYGATLDVDLDGKPLQSTQRYVYIIERGPKRQSGDEREARGGEEGGIDVGGQTLVDLANDDFSRFETLTEAKRLLRALINHTLGGQPLHARRVFEELQEL
ncbi:MAG: DNA repair protein RecO [Azoarcus sp.]|nr:DNA repair protein RecO [Azoarcus sp.]